MGSKVGAGPVDDICSQKIKKIAAMGKPGLGYADESEKRRKQPRELWQSVDETRLHLT